MDFKKFFSLAMGKDISPYPYQLQLSLSPWPDVIKVETGMGKTAAIILAWLYKRLSGDPSTPRRLVYCLPMRVLVEQIASNAKLWIDNLLASNIVSNAELPAVYTLMGGEIDNDWDRYPEKHSILVGTQDQLLSRALNRGYVMSRFRWPIHFALLNNDCLWVMDEIQLMGSGLGTSSQMQAFRERFGTIVPVKTLWMSATLQKDWLNTVDFADALGGLQEQALSEQDKKDPSVKKRFNASKKFRPASCPFDNPGKVAQLIVDAHRKGTRTLVVVNTVRRAVDIYSSVKKLKPKSTVSLLHSRFRPPDRENAVEKVLAAPDTAGSICITTQVVEAGVDITSATLITDLAPWPSLVQRFGRCNRYGDDRDAQVILLDMDLEKKGAALPYTIEELTEASEKLAGVKDVGPAYLPPVSSPAPYTHVIRSKDIVDLFDTTPDISGMDIDISRFIRDTDEHDASVFWREFAGDAPGDDQPAPTRDELCGVPVSD
ncbi:MAG: CRISPR-associated helicase Cas3', partial [Proteobacteria bacterium]|nr:CRISPR-associated helicase Cas3' [Pseudomonadota bacterium]